MENIVEIFLENEQIQKLDPLKELCGQASALGEPGMIIGQPNLVTGKIRFQFLPKIVGNVIVEAILAYKNTKDGMECGGKK